MIKRILQSIKKFWYWFVIGGVVIAAPLVIPDPPPPITLENPQVIQWVKPTTDAQWAEDVKIESLHLKFGSQLTDMKESLENKLPLQEADLDKITRCPECISWELEEQFTQMFDDAEIDLDKTLEGKTLQQWIDGEFAEQLVNTTWESEKVRQSIERIDNEIRLRASNFLTVRQDKVKAGVPERKGVGGIDSTGSRVRAPIGTKFFIDADCATPGDGTTATCNGDADDSFNDTLDFTESASAAGDIGIHRRGTTATYDDGTDLLFVNLGTMSNPIVIEAAYDDDWSDDADSTQTYTPVFGSKTMTASATISDISAGEWVYNTTDSDDPREFSYEVASVSGTTLTLFLPWKGSTGATKTLKIMPAAPIWGAVATSIQWNFDVDDYWKVQGIHIRGTDPNGQVELDSSIGHLFRDMIFEGNGASDVGIRPTDQPPAYYFEFYKTRVFNNTTSIMLSTSNIGGSMKAKDFLIDCNSLAGSTGIHIINSLPVVLQETEIINCTNALASSPNFELVVDVFLRNVDLSGSTKDFQNYNTNIGRILVEDYNGTIGSSRQLFGLAASDTQVLHQSDTGTTRSGGSNISIKITPQTDITTNWELSRIKLLEIPFYATTSSKKYEVFMRPTATTDWTADPTASELWCELEAWGHASNNFRKITKSTETIDMNGSTNWTSLSVTVAPAQAGVAYLRCYYAKTKEAGANTFFIDPLVVVT